jgi:homoserine dehydrogenase
MFTYGQSFESALKDAQAKGYAESNPDSDILGIDASRKIAILTALVTGKLLPVENIHTEGIVNIRSEDVKAAEKLGCTIKLVGRCINSENKPLVMVAPFLVPEEMSLSGVCGVYNAVEVIGDPLGNVMFYGQGAGAGATASAVVGDLCQIMNEKSNFAAPVFEKCAGGAQFSDFSSRHYIACEKELSEKLCAAFPEATVIENAQEVAVLTSCLKEQDVISTLEKLGISPLSRIRLLA